MADEPVADNVLKNCGVLYFHFFFGLSLILLGMFVIVTRLPHPFIQSKLRPWHATFGQLWVYGIMCQISTSLYCRGDGFRPFIFAFLVILIVGQIIGHAAIRAYQRGMQMVKDDLKDQGFTEPAALATEVQVAAVSRRGACGIPLLRLRQIHAFFMILSFLMLFGAGVMFTKRSKDLGSCRGFVAVRDSLQPGARIVERDGQLVMLPPAAFASEL